MNAGKVMEKVLAGISRVETYKVLDLSADKPLVFCDCGTDRNLARERLSDLLMDGDSRIGCIEVTATYADGEVMVGRLV